MQLKEDWFESWFDSPYYHILYKHRDDEEAKAFIDSLSRFLQFKPNDKILDLGCGKGRHAKYLSELSFETTGLDLSKESIKMASAFASDHLKFVVGDMRYFELNERFDAVCNLFTSFGYFNDYSDNLLVLNQIHRHLKPQGQLVIDYLNANQVASLNSTIVKLDIEGIQFETQKFIENNCICKRIDVRDDSTTHHFMERVQLLDLNWFQTNLAQCGFAIDHVFGDYQLNVYHQEQSPRLILVARKIQ